jgi:hypothetical protein
MQQCMYKFYPVLPMRKKSASSKRAYSVAENKTDDTHLKSQAHSRPYSVKYAELHVRCETADLRVDPDYNTKAHWHRLSSMSSANDKAQSKLADLTKEYYDRQAYNQLLGSNKKNFKKKHAFLNVYSVVAKRNYGPERYNLYRMGDKYYVEDNAAETHILPISECNHTYGTANKVCLNCRQNMDRLSANKRVNARTHQFSNEKPEVEISLKQAKPYQEVILPVSFFKTSSSHHGGHHGITAAAPATEAKQKSVRINSEFTKSEVVNDIFDFDCDIKPDLNLWTVV